MTQILVLHSLDTPSGGVIDCTDGKNEGRGRGSQYGTWEIRQRRGNGF